MAQTARVCISHPRTPLNMTLETAGEDVRDVAKNNHEGIASEGHFIRMQMTLL